MSMVIFNDDIIRLLMNKGYEYEEIYKLALSNEIKVIIEQPKDVLFAGKLVPLPYYYRDVYMEIYNNKYMLPNLDSIGTDYTNETNYKEELHNQKARLNLN